MTMATFPQTIYTTQRFNSFGFRPFLTNLEATIELEGDC